MTYNDVKLVIFSMCAWLYLCIVVFGIIGNTLTFIIFSRKKLAKMSFSVYFRLLVIFDSIVLIDTFNYFIKKGFDNAGIERSAFLCKTIHYVCDSFELSACMYIFAICIFL